MKSRYEGWRRRFSALTIVVVTALQNTAWKHLWEAAMCSREGEGAEEHTDSVGKISSAQERAERNSAVEKYSKLDPSLVPRFLA